MNTGNYFLHATGLLSSILIISSVQAAEYTLIDLGTFGRSQSIAKDINDHRQVIGTYYDSATMRNQQGFIWDQSTGMQSLGPADYWASEVIPYAINNNGQVVGDQGNHEFTWDQVNGMQRIPPPYGRTPILSVRDINDSGQVAGTITESSTGTHAFIWDANNGIQVKSESLGQLTFGSGINENGDLAGSSVLPTGDFRPVLWDENGIHNLGALGDTYSNEGIAINNIGQVIGNSTTDSNTLHPFIWDATNGMQDLLWPEARSGKAHDLNDRGTVIGEYLPDGEFISNAFVWDAGNGLQNLCLITSCELSGWEYLSRANGINEHGDIVGVGRINNETHAFLAQLVPVPLPAAIWLFGVGLVGLLAVSRKRK